MPDDYRNIRTHVIEPICCRQCDERAGFVGLQARFVVCKTCGNKRCPKATDHRLDCTGSNEPGQPGSAFAEQVAPEVLDLPLAVQGEISRQRLTIEKLRSVISTIESLCRCGMEPEKALTAIQREANAALDWEANRRA